MFETKTYVQTNVQVSPAGVPLTPEDAARRRARNSRKSPKRHQWWLGAIAGVPSPSNASTVSRSARQQKGAQDDPGSPMTPQQIARAKNALMQRSIKAHREGKSWTAIELAAKSVGLENVVDAKKKEMMASTTEAKKKKKKENESFSGGNNDDGSTRALTEGDSPATELLNSPPSLVSLEGDDDGSSIIEKGGVDGGGVKDSDEETKQAPIETCFALYSYNQHDMTSDGARSNQWNNNNNNNNNNKKRAKIEGHLSFAAGDEIALLRTDASGWWFGAVIDTSQKRSLDSGSRAERMACREDLAKRGGLFPANHVSTLHEFNHRNDPLLHLLTSCRLVQYYDGMRGTLGVDTVDDLELVEEEHLDMIGMLPMHKRRFYDLVQKSTSLAAKRERESSKQQLVRTVLAANAQSNEALRSQVASGEDIKDAAMLFEQATSASRYAAQQQRPIQQMSIISTAAAQSPHREQLLFSSVSSPATRTASSAGGEYQTSPWASELARQRAALENSYAATPPPSSSQFETKSPFTPLRSKTPSSLQRQLLASSSRIADHGDSSNSAPDRPMHSAGDFVILRNGRVSGEHSSSNPRYWIGRIVSIGAGRRMRLQWFAERPYRSGLYYEAPKTFVEKSDLVQPIEGMRFIQSKRGNTYIYIYMLWF